MYVKSLSWIYKIYLASRNDSLENNLSSLKCFKIFLFYFVLFLIGNGGMDEPPWIVKSSPILSQALRLYNVFLEYFRLHLKLVVGCSPLFPLKKLLRVTLL